MTGEGAAGWFRGFCLAPMAGYSDSAFRRLCLGFGASAAVTEMVSTAGLSRRSAATCRLLRRGDGERPLGVQLYGSSPEEFARAAGIVASMGFDFLDVNAGCPVRKVTRSASGSALLRDIPRLLDIVSAVSSAAGPLPVTVKIRLGWSPDEPVPDEIGSMLAARGASAIFVHGRYRSDMFSGRVDACGIARIAALSPVPVIANGDSSSVEAARDLLRSSGASGVMIGRGAIGRPWIFRALSGSGSAEPSREEFVSTVMRHLSMMKETVPPPWVYHLMRGHLVHYLRGFRGASALRSRAVSVESDEDVMALCLLAVETMEEREGDAV